MSGLALSTLLSSLGTSIANIGLPAVAQSFGATFQEVQWVVLGYLVILASLIVSVGRLGDILGRRRLLLAGIAVFTMASAASGLAPTLPGLIAVRAVQGLGAAAMMALTLAFVGEVVPQGHTGRAMGLLGTTSAIGTALGPSLGGVLMAVASWRALFLVNVPLGVAAFFLILRALPPDRPVSRTSQPGFDGAGTLLLALALGCYALAMTIGRNRFGALNLSLLAAAAGAAGLFTFVESRVRHPLLRWALLRNRDLRAALVASGLVSTVMMTTLVVGPFYLSLGLGLSPAIAGTALSTGPLVAALAGLPAGRMTDWWGAQRVTVLGLIGVAGGSILLSLLPASLGLAGYVLPLVVLTAGYALFQTANNTAVMRGVPVDQRGVVSGLLNLSRNLGLVTGASVMSAVFAVASGATEVGAADPGAVAAGMRVAFAAGGILAGCALAFVLGSRAR